MQLSKKGAAFIALHEGFRANWYRDPVGVLTIGIGFTTRSRAFRMWMQKNKPGMREGVGSLTRAEAEDALIYLVSQEYGKAVNDFLGKTVPQHVYDAMCSATFNLGPGALKWKWAGAAKVGDYAKAAAYLRKTGTTARGRTLPGLVRRRKEEALLLEKGVYTGVKAVDDKPAPSPKPPQKPADKQSSGAGAKKTLVVVVAALIAALWAKFEAITNWIGF